MRVKIGVVASMIEAFIASEYFNPRKKKAKFKFVPKTAARIKVLISALSIFMCFTTNGRSKTLAKVILIVIRENMGICVRVNFIIGIVAPQRRAATIR